MDKKETFTSLGLSKNALKAITQKGFTQPSAIQAKIIPLMLTQQCDIIGISQTGSGKTASFGLPLIDQLGPAQKKPTILVITPTRELALQVTTELATLQGDKKIRQVTLYGGAPIQSQIKQIQKGVDIVVGTPGRLCDLLEKKILHLTQLKCLVIDEADEMLKMGFIEDIKRILTYSADPKRILLFSATMPPTIQALAKTYMDNPHVVKVQQAAAAKPNITQEVIILKKSARPKALAQLLKEIKNFYGIIFCMTKKEVKELTLQLKEAGYPVESLHGDIIQRKREQVLRRFRQQKTKILIATDVASRGLDVPNLTHVINFSLPREEEIYIHRIGRTGRAGKQGIALSFVAVEKLFLIRKIEQITKTKMKRRKLFKDKKNRGSS